MGEVSKYGDDAALPAELKRLAQKKTAWGYRLLHGALRLEGWQVNHTIVHRLYREEKLALRTKGKKRFMSQVRGQVLLPMAPGQLWSMDFVHDALADGRSFRTLNLTDCFTRLCLAQEVDTGLSGQRVVRVLEKMRQVHGLPAAIRVDNGPEYRSKALDLWAYENNVKLNFIAPGKPTQNGQIESFNGRFRVECLNQEWFGSLQQASQKIEDWRISYNSQRPHSSLGYLPPDVWTQRYYQQQKNLMF